MTRFSEPPRNIPPVLPDVLTRTERITLFSVIYRAVCHTANLAVPRNEVTPAQTMAFVVDALVYLTDPAKARRARMVHRLAVTAPHGMPVPRAAFHFERMLDDAARQAVVEYADLVGVNPEPFLPALDATRTAADNRRLSYATV